MNHAVSTERRLQVVALFIDGVDNAEISRRLRMRQSRMYQMVNEAAMIMVSGLMDPPRAAMLPNIITRQQELLILWKERRKAMRFAMGKKR